MHFDELAKCLRQSRLSLPRPSVFHPPAGSVHILNYACSSRISNSIPFAQVMVVEAACGKGCCQLPSAVVSVLAASVHSIVALSPLLVVQPFHPAGEADIVGRHRPRAVISVVLRTCPGLVQDLSRTCSTTCWPFCWQFVIEHAQGRKKEFQIHFYSLGRSRLVIANSIGISH